MISFIFFLLTLPSSIFCQTQVRITVGSSFTATPNRNTSWSSSPNGDFAFGFREISKGSFLLAIWFNKITERTIVWSANGNKLAESGSKLELSQQGLVLSHKEGKEIWSSKTNDSSSVSFAYFLDSGNFVVSRNKAVSVWQSFDYPTDTILPNQRLNKDGQLFARYSDATYSKGRFKLIMQQDGNLVMYTTTYPLEAPNSPYWSTQSTIGSGYQVIFQPNGYLSLVAENKTVLFHIFSKGTPMVDYYQRISVDADGVLRQYTYSKKSNDGWKVLGFLPANICTKITADTGSGACGFNSYCKMEEDEKPTCTCPPGYDFMFHNDHSKGCIKMFPSQKCDQTNGFQLMEMINTDWPLSDYEHFTSVTEDMCRLACLGDCFCDVAIFREGNCWKKKLPLSNGRLDFGVGGKALIKVNSTV